MKRYHMIPMFLFVFVTLLCFYPGSVFAGISDCSDITTDKGKITGVFDDKTGVCSYLGIPYAAPPVGDLRFSLPAESSKWNETLVADEFSEQCLQFPISLFASTKVTGSEDCLYLNIWHPAEESPALKPVMFFIHGGGFIYGSGAQDIYEGTRLSKQGDVVVVTINYRLGPFGFFAHPALKDAEGRTGNYGIYDMIHALKWVRGNAKSFGGDPDNITIFGESAGGISVGVLLASPLAKGLYQKAIIESGPVILLTSTIDKAEAESMEGAETLGCPDGEGVADCLRNLSVDEFMKGVPPTLNFINETESKGGLPYMPVSGTDVIPEPMMLMLENGDFASDVPLMLGSNKDEASYFTASIKIDNEDDFDSIYDKYADVTHKHFGIDAFTYNLKALYPLSEYETPKKAFNDIFCDVAFTCPTRLLAKQVARLQPDVFLYHFVKSPQDKGPMADWGAFHGSELAFVFGNFSFMGIKFSSPDNRKLASKMIGYWSSFAWNGVPGNENLPEWPRFTPDGGEYLELGNEIIPGASLKKERCDLLEKVLMEMVQTQKEL